MKGPIATTLENERQAFLNVDDETPGKNVYPRGLTREEMDAYFAREPERRDELLDLRAVVQSRERRKYPACCCGARRLSDARCAASGIAHAP